MYMYLHDACTLYMYLCDVGQEGMNQSPCPLRMFVCSLVVMDFYNLWLEILLMFSAVNQPREFSIYEPLFEWHVIALLCRIPVFLAKKIPSVKLSICPYRKPV